MTKLTRRTPTHIVKIPQSQGTITMSVWPKERNRVFASMFQHDDLTSFGTRADVRRLRDALTKILRRKT